MRGRRYGASAGNASTGPACARAGTWSRRERGRGGNVVEAIGKRARPTSRCRSLLSPFLCPVVRTLRPRRASPPCRRRSAFEQAHLQAQRHHGMWHEPEAPRGGRRRRHPCSAATQRRVHEPAPATRGARVELVVVVVLRRRRSRTCRSPSTITRVEEEPGPNTRWWTLPTTTSADEERYTKNREEEPGGDGAGVLPGRRSTRSEQPRGPPSA